MSIFKIIYKHFANNITTRRVAATVLGNIILAFGISLLKLSGLGNDSCTAMNMAISDGLHMGLGTYTLIFNCVLLMIQLIYGRKYIGLGTIVNMTLLGYIVQIFVWCLVSIGFNTDEKSIIIKLIIMVIALIIIGFGLSMYQLSNLGTAPYDYLSLGISEVKNFKYFFVRMGTDLICVLVILIAVFTGFISINESHLGIGTVCCALLLGPICQLFNNINKRWIK